MKLEKLNSKIFKAVSNEELVKMEGGGTGARWSWRRIKHGADSGTIISIEEATVVVSPSIPSDAVLDAAFDKALNLDFDAKVNAYKPLFTTTTLTK